MILTDDEIKAAIPSPKTFGEYQAPWSETDVEMLVTIYRSIESALLAKLRGGVELPEPFAVIDVDADEVVRVYSHGDDLFPDGRTNTYSREQVNTLLAARALAAREQAIEECAKVCISLYESQAINDSDKAMDCADAIRALAASPQEQT